MSRRVILLALGLAAGVTLAVSTEGQQPPAVIGGLGTRIDEVVRKALAAAGVPSASIAVVQNGQIAYVQAYGQARLDPPVPATPAMRYGIGSISKQFTSAAMLLLQERGALSLDDRVGRFFPALTRANDVTIRQLLSHTSGYQDYWPQDYVPPFMLQPVTADKIMELWARKPLDFEPGTKWQYSNTNYVIAGAIVEKAAGMPLISFLTDRIFRPLGMTGVVNIDQEKLTDSDPIGYMRFALGPLRPAPKEGRGWLFAAGELAMTASDLARWDISLMDQKLLKPASYKELETTVLLKNGMATGYGLGVDVGQNRGRRTLGHGGEVSGFTAENLVLPDDRAAIAVLTNQDAVSASGAIAQQLAPLIVEGEDPAAAAKLAQARKVLEASSGHDRPEPLHGERQRLFQRAGAEGLRDRPCALGMRSHSSRQAMAHGGHDAARIRGEVRRQKLAGGPTRCPDGKLEQFQAPE
jgi:CubicO group peptidase (beta-lactamase class C family)